MSERSEYGPREYLSDDRDLEENRLIIDQGGNGDWYVKIVRPGERVGVAVRVTTSGARRGAEHVARAVFGLWRAMNGDDPWDEHKRLADACSRFFEAIAPGWYGDMPAGMEAIAEAAEKSGGADGDGVLNAALHGGGFDR